MKPRALSLLRSLSKRASHNPFIFLWVVNLLICEVLVPRIYISSCSWPVVGKNRRDEVHLAVIADPQLTDAYSYHQSGLKLRLTSFYSDLYMRRNFRLISSKLEPHGYWVLGDIMDGGREWVGNQASRYESEAQRVKSVFNVRDGTPIFWAAGNHDIGFGDKVIPEAYDRYRAVFGEPNYAVEVANHTLIVLDTVSLSGPAGTRPADAALDFLTDFSEGESSSNPRILGTHVPLYRRDDHDCGKLRRNPPMKQGRGYQYQNLVVESLSKHILEKIKPSLVLSGDDHDWCENEHTFESGTAKEYTVATFSWMQGNVHPGYALLTLLPSHAAPHPTTPTQTFALATCPLPPQIPVYIWYAFLALITLPLLLHWTYRQVWADAPSYIQIPMFSYGNQRGEFLRRSARRRSARLSVANSRGRGGGGVVARVCARAPGLWMLGDGMVRRRFGANFGEVVVWAVGWYVVLLVWESYA